jgi:predicted GIY-YIG superfamily endonuclease
MTELSWWTEVEFAVVKQELARPTFRRSALMHAQARYRRQERSAVKRGVPFPPFHEWVAALEAQVETLVDAMVGQQSRIEALERDAAVTPSRDEYRQRKAAKEGRVSRDADVTQPMTPAERAKAYRARKAVQHPKLLKRIAAGEVITWHVYELVDPRTEKAFYVGITTAPRERVSGHRTDGNSAAKSTVRDIHAAGLKCTMHILAKYPDKASALAHEDRLIRSLPGLVNRPLGGQKHAAAKVGSNVIRLVPRNVATGSPACRTPMMGKVGVP